MHQFPIEQQILLVIEIAALAILCLRIWLAGLHKVYVCFFGYLILELVQALIPVVAPLDSRLYVNLYMVSQALIVAFYAFVVLELYANVLRDLPGIASIARRYIEFMLVLSIGVALLPLYLEKTVDNPLGYLFACERTIMSSLMLFVLLVSAFLVYYPIPLGRNVIAYLAGYAVWFLTKTTTTLIVNLGHYWIRPLSTINMVVSVLCLIFWIFALRREGDAKRIVVGHQWNPEDDQRLLAQLDAINASLQRSRGK
jgi:hypothetical protein